jgi:hypothetical protein
MGPAQVSFQWVPAFFPQGTKRLASEVDHSPPSSVEVKNGWSYTYIPPLCLRYVENDYFIFIKETYCAHNVIYSYHLKMDTVYSSETVAPTYDKV